jgi:tetratricopeptide (TPR) repeat protein
MAKWAKYPHEQKTILYVGEALKKHWNVLHRGDNEPFPRDASLQEAWRQYHAGNFADAVAAAEGSVAAIKATAIYATHLETRTAAKGKLFQAAMEMADGLRQAEPNNINAHYQYAYAAGRYAQSVSVINALKEGYGGKIKRALDTVLKLDPKHAEAHSAMGAYHAEIIDKIGGMVAKLTYGASKEAALLHFRKSLQLVPESPIANIEYANGLLLLFGDKEVDQASALYEKAAKMTGHDAMEVLDIALANAQLEDE